MDGEDEDQPAYRGKKLAHRKAVDVNEEFDPAEFEHCPIDAQNAIKLNNMAQDWSQMQSYIQNTVYSLLNEVAAAVAETADDKESKVRISALNHVGSSPPRHRSSRSLIPR